MSNSSTRITIIDSMMGTGKTSYAIQFMQEAPLNQKFIYVTPFLDEVERIKTTVSNREFKEPTTQHGSGTKLVSLKRLVASGCDIATTHALFGMADDELVDLLRWENYSLIVDEVMDVVAVLPGLRKGDIPTMLNGGLIEIDPSTSQVVWRESPNFDTTFHLVRDYALAGNLYAVNNTAFVWNFPAKIFHLFNQVFIMTYLFDGQLQRYYYDLHGIEYDYVGVRHDAVGGRYELVLKSEIIEDRSRLRELIQVYDGKLNDIGHPPNALSKSWFDSKRNSDKRKRLKNDLYNYYRHITNSDTHDFLWTTFKSAKTSIQGRGFSRDELDRIADTDCGSMGTACFVPFNLRATNKYRHKTVLAFCLNRYINPIEKHFFDQRGVQVDQDLLALSDLLQWIFRSAVRDGNPVQLYVPSRRMRDLLYRWLDGEL